MVPCLGRENARTREAPECRAAASGSQHVDVLLAQLRGHRSAGPDCARPNSHLTARETKCSDCGHRQRQSASSNPPAKSPKNHIIDDVFTQPCMRTLVSSVTATLCPSLFEVRYR